MVIYYAKKKSAKCPAGEIVNLWSGIELVLFYERVSAVYIHVCGSYSSAISSPYSVSRVVSSETAE